MHPASGYMINRVVLQAPEVAAAIADTLRGNGSPKQAAEAAWEAIWPKHRLIERDLYCFGMEVLLDLDLALLRDFFRAFFTNPRAKMWREFLAWNMTQPGEKPYKMSVFMILQVPPPPFLGASLFHPPPLPLSSSFSTVLSVSLMSVCMRSRMR